MDLTRIVEIFEIHTGKFINSDIETEIPEQKGFSSCWVMQLSDMKKYRDKDFCYFLEQFAENKIQLHISSYYDDNNYEYYFENDSSLTGTVTTNDYIYCENFKIIVVKNVEFIFTKEFTKLIRPDLYQIQMDDLFKNKINNSKTQNLFIHFN